MYFDFQSVKSDELFSKCWLAGTNMKAFFSSIVQDELLNINIPLICDEIQNNVNKRTNQNSLIGIPFNVCGHLLFGAVRIYREQVNILYEQTNYIFNLNSYYSAQRSSFFNNLVNKEMLYESQTLIESYISSDDCDDTGIEDELNTFLAESERCLTKNINQINKKITINDGQTENNYMNDNNEIDDKTNSFDQLTNKEISDFIDLMEGRKTFFDCSNDETTVQKDTNTRNSDIDNSIEPLRNIEINEFENNLSLQEFNKNVSLTENVNNGTKSKINDQSFQSDILQEISYQQNLSNELIPIEVPGSPNISIQDDEKILIDDDGNDSYRATRIVIPRVLSRKRKRKQLQIDSITQISSGVMRQQISNYTDTLRCSSFLAKKFTDAIHLGRKYIKPSTILFSNPGHENLSTWQRKLFKSNLETKTETYDCSIIEAILHVSSTTNNNYNTNTNTEAETVENIDRYIKRKEVIDQLQIDNTETESFLQHQNILTEQSLLYNLQPDILDPDNSSVKFESDVVNNSPKISRKIFKFTFVFEEPNEKNSIKEENIGTISRNYRSDRSKITAWNEEGILNKLDILWKLYKDQITIEKLCENVDRLTASKIFTKLLELNAKGYIKLHKISETNNGYYIKKGDKID